MANAEELMAAQMRFMHAIVKTRSKFSLMPGETHILGYLINSASGIAPLEVFRKMLEINASTMTAMIKRMVDKGLITTMRDEKNRRQQLIKITPLGADSFTKVREEWKTLWQHILDQMGKAQAYSFIVLTNHVAKLILESEGLSWDTSIE